MKTKLVIFMVLMVTLSINDKVVMAQDTVVGSPHDLSVSGPGPIHALYEEQVCIFCHAPHHATGQAPLWNRHMPPTHYRIYESSTTDARIDQPSGPSKMCLSCHDGALALGLVASRPINQPMVMSHRTIPPGPSDLTQDLSDDHPIGFRYDRPLAARDRQLKNPDLISKELPLGKHNELHCTTCHDPHNNKLGDFLRITDVRSAICLSCHQLRGWDRGSHARSQARITGRSVDPRERLPYHTVADNACTNCHKIHSAEGRERLLRFRREENNCLNCHNGSVARTNIASDLRKASAHPVDLSARRHDPNENPRTMPRHVECEDCHNPHAATASLRTRVRGTSIGLQDGTTRFVSGIDRAGRNIERSIFEYQICFKCHADGVNRNRRPEISRQITQTNTRREFQPTNPSFHPVIAARRNNNVVSLLPPLRVGSQIRCTDCHNSDQAGQNVTAQPAGPHGSIYTPLLIDNYSTNDFTSESARAYALCYRCHERQSILNDESFSRHSEHIVRGRTPCSACHDAHGISRTQGNSRNNSNLINFDRSIVQPASAGLSGRILFEDLGTHRGRCTLTCHGVVHIGFEYSP
ncbi:MAG: cytochrome c3 family protein [Planctomycetota bacterium]|jgi:predicted CXXCH cytochrome family protein